MGRSRSRSRSRDRSGRRRRRSSSRERRSSRRSRSRDRVSKRSRSISSSRSPPARRRRRSRSNSSDYGNEMIRECWRAVNRDRSDFKAWTTLLNYVEQANDMRSARDAFKMFFEHYPFCYGYWRKYADMERRNENYSRAQEVYEKGVEAVGISSDLWISYAAFLRQQHNESSDDVKKIRKVYQRAVDTCGRDFRSDKLWEEYLLWEGANGELRNVMALYDQLLATPTFQFAQNVERFRQFVATTNPKETLSSKEFEDICERIQTKTPELILFDDDKNITPEGLHHFQQAILETRAEKIEKNSVRAQERWTFETAIKRPYFHVTALESAELKIWDQYLDFEMSCHKLPHKAVDVLFERCVVSCALYDHFWTKYISYLNAYDPEDTSKIRETYRRALIHVPRQVDIHLAYSAFEERLGNTTEAIDVLHKFDRRQPHFVAVESRLLQIEYRQAKKKGGDYGEIILRYEKLIHNSQSPKEVTSFYAMRLANLHAKIRNDLRLAEKVLKDAINMDRRNPRLYSALIDLAYSHQPLNEEAVIRALDTAIDSDLSYEHRLKFSQNKLDFLEQFGTDVKEHQKALGVHTRLKGKVNTQTDQSSLQSGFFSRNGTTTVTNNSNNNVIPVVNSNPSTVITLADPSV
uniref:Pre-mRNA-processing factor 39 n=1 Tax=Steinernema glaseri TaxID=37863 RepID=A0A1I7YFX1_9BILA